MKSVSLPLASFGGKERQMVEKPSSFFLTRAESCMRFFYCPSVTPERTDQFRRNKMNGDKNGLSTQCGCISAIDFITLSIYTTLPLKLHPFDWGKQTPGQPWHSLGDMCLNFSANGRQLACSMCRARPTSSQRPSNYTIGI